MSIEELEAEALKLPSEQRERLAEKLLSSIDTGLEYEAEWAAEADRRVQEVRDGAVKTIPASKPSACSRATAARPAAAARKTAASVRCAAHAPTHAGPPRRR